MNENFIQAMENVINGSTRTDKLLANIIKTIDVLGEDEFNELDKVCNTLDRFLPFIDYDTTKRYIYASNTLFLASKVFRYKVFVKSKNDIRYRYFLRLCFNYLFRFRDEEKNRTILEKIFRYYEPEHEGYKDMKKKMLQCKLEDRGDEELYEF